MSKLLIITQKVDSKSRMAFFLEWIKEFSKHYSKVNVICLEKGSYELPKNVEIHSLGKELGRSKVSQLRKFYRLRRELDYDKVFIHMGAIWALLGFFKKKNTFLWYVHRSNTLTLRLAQKRVNKILTATKESITLANRSNIEIIGHGIDDSLYKYSAQKKSNKILVVARITKIKNIGMILDAFKKLKGMKLEIIGAPVTDEDKKLSKRLKDKIKKEGIKNVKFLGFKPAKELPRYYKQAAFTVNACPTGGLDKVVLESIFSGRMCFVRNTTFKKIYGNKWKKYSFSDADELVKKMKAKGLGKDARELRSKLKKHSVEGQIKRIVKIIN